jgi:hypothetical protein
MKRFQDFLILESQKPDYYIEDQKIHFQQTVSTRDVIPWQTQSPLLNLRLERDLVDLHLFRGHLTVLMVLIASQNLSYSNSTKMRSST